VPSSAPQAPPPPPSPPSKPPARTTSVVVTPELEPPPPPPLPPPLPPSPRSELLALGGVFVLAVGGTFALGICGVALRERGLLACLGAPRSRPLLAGVASSTATPRREPPGRGVEVVATPYLD